MDPDQADEDLLRDALVMANLTMTNGTSSELRMLSAPSRIALTVILSVIILLTVGGNSLVLTVIVRHRGMRTRTNMFLFNLAAVQLLVAICHMPLSLVTAVLGRWQLGDVLCIISGVLTPVFFTVSLQTHMYISVHKCISIRKPTSQLLSRARVWMLLVVSWLVGALAGYMAAHGFTKIETRSLRLHCYAKQPNSDVALLAYIVCLVLLYCIPVAVMCGCYAAVFHEMRVQYGRIEKTTVSRRDAILLQQQRITTTLFIVMAICIFLALPYFILSIYDAFGNGQLGNVASCCLYLSCVFNPLVYALRSPAFREGYKQLLCARQPAQPIEGSDPNLASSMKGLRCLLRESFPPSLHGSGSMDGSSFNVSSRKSSLTSIAQYLLFPKSKSLSTSSLPRNFRYSVHSIDAVDTTQVSIICGVPVLTKHGKIVAYCDPTQTQRKKTAKSPVFYPSTVAPRICYEAESSTSQEPEEKYSEEITYAEHSPLLVHTEQTMFAYDVNALMARAPQRASICSAVIANEPSSKRNSVSAESGFVEETTGHTTSTEACSPPVPGGLQRTSSLHGVAERNDIDTDGQLTAGDAGAIASSTSFLAVPQPLSPLLKSNSETCIRPTPLEETKRGSDPSTSKGCVQPERKNVIQRIFSSMRQKRSDDATVRAVEVKESPTDSAEKLPKRSPSSSPKLTPSPQILLPVTFQANISKSASDTYLGGLPWEDHQTKRPKKRMSEKARKSDQQKTVKRSSQRGRAKDDTWWNVEHHYVETSMRRTMSAKYKTERCPSIETLHSQGGLKRCVSDVGHKKNRHHRKLKLPDATETARAKKAEITNALKSKPVRAPVMPTGALYRAISDPAFTFTMLEEKVHQRHLVKQWNKRKVPPAESHRKNLEVPNIMVELVDNAATGIGTLVGGSTACLTSFDNVASYGRSTDALQDKAVGVPVDLFLSKVPIVADVRIRSGIIKKKDAKHGGEEKKWHVKINENGMDVNKSSTSAIRLGAAGVSFVGQAAGIMSPGALRPASTGVSLSQSVGSSLDMAGSSDSCSLSLDSKSGKSSSELCLLRQNKSDYSVTVKETAL